MCSDRNAIATFIEDNKSAQGLKISPMFPKPPEKDRFAGMYYELLASSALGDKVERSAGRKTDCGQLRHCLAVAALPAGTDAPVPPILDDAYTQGKCYFELQRCRAMDAIATA